jgi:hypothetical protein
VEKRRLKRLAIDLKQRLNRYTAAIKQGAAKASLMAFKVAPISTLPGSTTLETTVVSLQPLTVAFEVATIGQQPSSGGEGPTGWPLCPTIRGAVTPTSRGDSPTYQWVLGSHDNKGCLLQHSFLPGIL